MAQRRRAREEPAPEDQDLGPPADPESVARKILLDRLTGQARSRAELAKALGTKNVPDDVATAVLDRFEEVGLIDDQAFAAAWVESRQSTRKLSRRALAFELRRKGIDDEVIAESIDAIDPEYERELARNFVDQKLRSTRNLDRQSRYRRLMSALARKGYPSGLSAAVVREAIAADEVAVGAPGAGELDEVIREDFGLD
jgi:regulatory protein